MEPSEACRNLVMESEGCLLDAYVDTGGVTTIGYGHTGPDVHLGLTWTPRQCEDALSRDLETAGASVSRLVTVSLSQGQFDALTDFCFNMGAGSLASSTLLKKLNLGDYAGVPWELYREVDGVEAGWIYGGDRILPGLVTRRKKEIALWNS